MGFFDKLLGGTDKSSLKNQIRDNKERQDFIKQQMGQARGDVMSLIPGMEQNANMGFQAGLDVYGQTIPQMFDVFQQGNVGAQNQLIAGMPQVHNAILGMPVDYSAFQPTQISYDAGYSQQSLPDFVSVANALGGTTATPQGPAPGGSGFYNRAFYP